MASRFPCPNPACSHTFSAEDVRGVAQLTCPQCGNVFRFKTQKKQPPQKPTPHAPIPVAKPVTAEEPVVPPSHSPSSPPPPQDSFVAEPLSARRYRRKQTPRALGRWLTLLFLLIVLFVPTGFFVYHFRDAFREAVRSTAQTQRSVVSKSANYNFVYPQEWQQDKGTQNAFGATLVMQREDPQAWLALVVSDYKNRQPRPDELLRYAVDRLREFFEPLEWEQKEDGTLAGWTAQRIVFQGSRNGTRLSGECSMLAYFGVGYWFFHWTPSENDLSAAQSEWAQIREGFTLLGQRKGWKGKQPTLFKVTAGENPSFTLQAAEDLWERLEPSTGAEVVLLGKDPEDPKDALKRAMITVYIREADADGETALSKARDFAQAKEKENFAAVMIEPIAEEEKSGLPEGEITLGEAKARVARLKVSNGPERVRFFAVVAVPREEYTLVFVCDCAWDQRDAWEGRFGPILRSLNFS